MLKLSPLKNIHQNVAFFAFWLLIACSDNSHDRSCIVLNAKLGFSFYFLSVSSALFQGIKRCLLLYEHVIPVILPIDTSFQILKLVILA